MDPLDRKQAKSSKALKFLGVGSSRTGRSLTRRPSLPYYTEDLEMEEGEDAEMEAMEDIDLEFADGSVEEKAMPFENAQLQAQAPESISISESPASSVVPENAINLSLSPSESRSIQISIELPPVEQYHGGTIPSIVNFTPWSVSVPFPFLCSFFLAFLSYLSSLCALLMNLLLYILPFIDEFKESVESKAQVPLTPIFIALGSFLICIVSKGYLISLTMRIFVEWPIQPQRFRDVYSYTWKGGPTEPYEPKCHPGLKMGKLHIWLLLVCLVVSVGGLVASFIYYIQILEPISAVYPLSPFQVLLSSIFASFRAIQPILFLVMSCLFIFGLCIFVTFSISLMLRNLSRSFPHCKHRWFSIQSMKWSIFIGYVTFTLLCFCLVLSPPLHATKSIATKVLVVNDNFHSVPDIQSYMFLKDMEVSVPVAYAKTHGRLHANTTYIYNHGEFQSPNNRIVFDPNALILTRYDAYYKPLVYSQIYFTNPKYLDAVPGISVDYAVAPLYSLIALKIALSVVFSVIIFRS